MAAGRERFGVLFVCTGDRCRSPAAAMLTRRLLTDRFGPDEATAFEITTAGTEAVAGTPVDPLIRAELHRLGVGDVGVRPHATALSADRIQAADLVLTAERAHRSAVVQMAASALGKTFCLREFARLVSQVDCPDLPDEPVALARAAVAAARANRGLAPPVAPAEDEIPDPFGRSKGAQRSAVALISSAVARILGVPAPVASASNGRRRGRSMDDGPQAETASEPAPEPAPAPASAPATHAPRTASFDELVAEYSFAPATEPDAPEMVAGPQRTMGFSRLPSADREVPAAPGRTAGMPAAMRASLGCWAGGTLACLVGLYLSLLDLRGERAALVDTALQAEPDAGAELVNQAVDIMLYGALGATAFLAGLQALLAMVTRLRRRWARVLLALGAVLNVPVVLLAIGVASDRAGWAFLAELGLMLPAAVAMFLPGANRWFRRRPSPRNPADVSM